MRLNGTTINFLGDSITFGSGTTSIDKRFTNVIKDSCQLKAANNHGIGGTRIARQPIVTDNPHDQDFCMRLINMPLDADAVVVFGGTNDYGHGDAPLGIFSDRSETTFYGACHYLMNSLLERFVGKPILIVTPLHRINENVLERDDGIVRAAPLKTYRNILIEVAQYYALTVLDLYATSGIQPENVTCRNALCPDGLHPNDAGHAIIARKMASFLETL